MAKHDHIIVHINTRRIFGSGTPAAVISFQQDTGLTAGGIVGDATKEPLIDELNGLGSSQFGPRTVKQGAILKSMVPCFTVTLRSPPANVLFIRPNHTLVYFQRPLLPVNVTPLIKPFPGRSFLALFQ